MDRLLIKKKLANVLLAVSRWIHIFLLYKCNSANWAHASSKRAHEHLYLCVDVAARGCVGGAGRQLRAGPRPAGQRCSGNHTHVYACKFLS